MADFRLRRPKNGFAIMPTPKSFLQRVKRPPLTVCVLFLFLFFCCCRLFVVARSFFVSNHLLGRNFGAAIKFTFPFSSQRRTFHARSTENPVKLGKLVLFSFLFFCTPPRRTEQWQRNGKMNGNVLKSIQPDENTVHVWKKNPVKLGNRPECHNLTDDVFVRRNPVKRATTIRKNRMKIKDFFFMEIPLAKRNQQKKSVKSDEKRLATGET